MIALLSAVVFSGTEVCAQSAGYDVFIPIAKYIRLGDADRLSAWFDDNLEISILSKTSDSSRSQALRIIKAFFNNFNPREFDITHTAGRSNMKYALGRLNAGGEIFEVTIFVSCKDDSYRIQQIKISKKE
ncbi:MAG: DUF4783 domain-containing protein [Candidatus Cryptobacteroides sp.]